MSNGVIFVPESNSCIEEYSSALNWLYDNPMHKNVMRLTEDEIMLLQYQSNFFYIINEENNGFLENGEDDWIFDEQVKKIIFERLSLEFKENLPLRVRELLIKIIELIKISMKSKTHIYFVF